MLQYLQTKISNAWGTFWAWMYNSGTVAWNWVVSILGAAVTTVAALDFSTLLTLDRQQAYVMGGLMFFQGIIQNVIRMSGTKVVDNHLLPTAEAMKAEGVRAVVTQPSSKAEATAIDKKTVAKSKAKKAK